MEINKNKTFSIPFYAIFLLQYLQQNIVLKNYIKEDKNDNFMPMI